MAGATAHVNAPPPDLRPVHHQTIGGLHHGTALFNVGPGWFLAPRWPR